MSDAWPIAVAPHRELKGFDGVTAGRGPELYRVRSLREALEDTYATDAHFVAYVVEGREMQPRILKRAWELIGAAVTVGVFFADVDTPSHGKWDFAFYDQVMTAFEKLPILAHAGLYLTMHGARIVQPLDRRISVGEVEPFIETWLHELIDAGLHKQGVAHVDLACRDWTRHFRAPHVQRRIRGQRRRVEYTSPRVDLARMGPISPPTPRARAAPARTKPPARPSPPPPLKHAPTPTHVPDEWTTGVRVLGDACARIHDGRHELYLALAGALVDKGVVPELLAPLLHAVANRAGDPNVRNRENCGETTAERVRAGVVIKGYGTLRLKWPEIASALDVAIEWSAKPTLAAVGTLGHAETELREQLRAAPDGVTILAAECGLGKTHAFLEAAIERARKPGRDGATRAPLGSRTVLSVDKHSLAIQCFEQLQEADVPVQRLFSPASLKDADGHPVCQKHEVARALVAGGQAMRWELCEGRGLQPCEHLNSCAATHGYEGDEDARIVIGVHPQLAQLARIAGTTGLLGIDEPPPLPRSTTITMADLDLATRELMHFDGIFASAIRPALNALWAWLRYCPSSKPVGLREALSAQRWGERADDLAWARAGTLRQSNDLAELVKATVSDEHHRKGPPLKWEAVQMALGSAATAQRIGRASRVLDRLQFALTTPGVVKLYATGDEHEAPAAVITHIDEPLHRALSREGRTIVLDANANTNLPLYTKALGYEPELFHFAAPDGAPIERTLLRCSKATRVGWGVEADRFDASGGSFRKALDAVVEWALEQPAETMAIITMKTIRQLLEDCLLPDEQIPDGRYDGRRRLLKAAREHLAPTLRRFPGSILWGHYGALRGLNDMADVDLIVTMGDPRPNVTATENDLALLELDDDAANRRVDQLAQAELEQAHGRLRAPRRTRPARALHVGTIRPGGTGWSGEVAFREIEGGRPSTAVKVHPVKVRALVEGVGGPSAAAEILGVSRRSVHRFLTGKRSIDAGKIALLKSAFTAAMSPDGGVTKTLN